MGFTNLWFSHVNHLLKMKGEVNFIHMLQNIACLKIVAHVSESHEIALLMEFLNGETMQSNKNQQRNGMRKISRKELLVYITHLNTTVLNGIMINYNVVIHHENRGENCQ